MTRVDDSDGSSLPLDGAAPAAPVEPAGGARAYRRRGSGALQAAAYLAEGRR